VTSLTNVYPSAVDVDYAFIVKGQGALIAAIPDGTDANGDKRGIYALDLQLRRNFHNQVAGGPGSVLFGSFNSCPGYYSSVLSGEYNGNAAAYTVICGGIHNGSFGSANVIGGGDSNSLANNIVGTVSDCVIGGGYGNSIESGSSTIVYSYGTISGGQNNYMQGVNAGTICGGTNNTINANWGTICGGRDAIVRGTDGVVSYANGMFSVKGDNQWSRFILKRQTTDATTSTISTDQAAVSSTNSIVLPANSTFGFRGYVVSRTSAGVSKMWEIKGLVKQGATASTTALVGTPTGTGTTGIFADSGASAWSLTITANTTVGALSINITGAAATTIRTVANIETYEIVF